MMISITHADYPRRGSDSFLHDAAISIVFAMHIIQCASIFTIFNADAVRIAFIIQLLVYLTYLWFCIRSSMWPPILMSVAVIALLLMQSVVFSFAARSDININAILPYLSVMAVCVFYYCNRTVDQVLSICFWVSLSYLLFYIITYNTVLSMAVERVGTGVLGGSDEIGERQDRVVLATSYAAVVIAYAIGCLYTRRLFISAVGISIGSIAIYLAQTRLFSAVLLVSVIFSIFKFGRQIAPTVFVWVFFLISGFLVLCVAIGHNPFMSFADDSSALARALSFVAASSFLGESPLLGIGIAPDDLTLQAFARSAHPLYGSDLGPIGIWLYFGLIGMLMFSLTSYICLSQTHPEKPRALTIIGQVIGLYGILAPVTWGGSGTVILALILALSVQRRFPRTA